MKRPLLAVVLVIACASPPEPVEPARELPANEIVGAFVDAGIPDDWPCPDSFGPHGVGKVLSYRYTAAFTQSSGRTGTGTFTLIERVGERVTGRMVWDVQPPSGPMQHSVTELRFTCRADGERQEGGSDATSSWTFSPSQLVSPAHVDVGTAWTTEGTLTMTNDGRTSSSPYRYAFRVVDRRSITVPAGTFEALVVETTWSETSGNVEYWVKGLGAVKSDVVELVGITEPDR